MTTNQLSRGISIAFIIFFLCFKSNDGSNPTNEPRSRGKTFRSLDCNGPVMSVNSSGYVLTSLGFPSSYPKIDCRWKFSSDPGTTFLVSFTDFSTRPGDFVSIYDGYVITKFRIHTEFLMETGINASSPLSCNYLSKTNKILVNFTPRTRTSSSLMMPRAGFRVILKPTSDRPVQRANQRCGGSYSDSAGNLRFPYQRNGQQFVSGDCNWQIQVEEGSQVNLTVNNMGGPIADIYSLEIFEGENASGDANFLASVRHFSNFSQPFFVVSKTNKITVVLKESLPRRGYSSAAQCLSKRFPELEMLYTTTTSQTFGCYGRMNLNTRQLSPLPDQPNPYAPSSLRCKWRVGAASVTSVGDAVIENQG